MAGQARLSLGLETEIRPLVILITPNWELLNEIATNLSSFPLSGRSAVRENGRCASLNGSLIHNSFPAAEIAATCRPSLST